MRICRLEGLDVLGSQYLDGRGCLNWYVAVLSGQNSTPQIHHIVAGELFENLRSNERDAVSRAIEFWESQPVVRPH
jgi:hypothetical protein